MRRLLALVVLTCLATPAAAQGPAAATASVCFRPGPANCADLIVDQINDARSTVRVQAYYLTSPPILRALTAAKRRGVDVEAILDKSQDRRGSSRSRYTGATYLANAGVPVWIDDPRGIAHNKIIILDGHTVITGSFNFTKAAEKRNVVNVVVLDSPEVASWFTANWTARQSVSYRFETGPPEGPER